MKRRIDRSEKDGYHEKETKIVKRYDCDTNFPEKFFCSSRGKFDLNFPNFRKPVENGCFSQDHSRVFHTDKRQMRYYCRPPNDRCVAFDLAQGYKDLIRKDETKNEYLDDMLKWTMCHRHKFSLKESTEANAQITSLNTDFISWRGLMTKLLCTPYENRDGWKIGVTLFRGTYYMCEFDTEDKKKQKDTMTERQDEMCYWGWKFEQYVTAGSPKSDPILTKPVNNNEGFCSVVRTRLNRHSLVFGGEVDAIDPRSDAECKYVEMKTTREIETPRQDENFRRFRLIKWWAQSFLIGIPKIVCGFRDDDGVVRRLEEFDTKKIPDMAKTLRDPWKPAVCFNFLDQFLKFIKETVKMDDSRIVYLFEWTPRRDVLCNRMNHDSQYTFLPDWFCQWEAWK